MAATTTSQTHFHNQIHPNIYVAPFSKTSIKIDGDIEKAAWADIPWSSDFDDIRGPDDASADDRPSPKCQTKFKMQWDHQYLYILAIIHSDMEVPATFRKRNSPIFHRDSDFEVFVDPLGSCHFYKELEMNAINTVWNLMLDRPYDDGGTEHSARIAKFGDPNYYEVQHQKTAAKLLKGELNNNESTHSDHHNQDNNDEEDINNVWAVEIALAHTDTLKRQVISSPKVGARWRINFSRVENKGGINWTWQPQRIWDPILRKHIGKVNMHLPDAWGYVQFTPALDECTDCSIGQVPLEKILEGKGDPLWPARLTLMNVYYSQKRYRDVHGAFASDLTSLRDFTDAKIIAPFVNDSTMKLTYTEERNENGFIFTIHSKEGIINVTSDRLIKVHDSTNPSTGYIIESF